MRVIFMGSPAAAIHPLRALLASSNHEVCGVVSQPAKPSGRKRQLQDPPVATFAKEAGLPVWQPEKARDPEFIAMLSDLKPDVIVTAAYGQILSESFLQIPQRATINIHPSLLPHYRGAIPVPAALLDGCEQTGVTILFTVKALDAGHIILQEETPIGADENAADLLERLFVMSGPLLCDALQKLEDPTFVGEPQDESRVTHCKKISKEDGLVDWAMPAKEIYNRFRAFQPWPGLYTFLAGKRVAISAVAGTDGQQSAQDPGSFAYDKKQKTLSVSTGDGMLLVERLKPEGGKEMEAAGFWNGWKDKAAHCFTSKEPTGE